MIGKEYLGDGVYVEVENGGLALTTENGIEVTNTIFLEVEVYRALMNYFERAVKAAEAAPAEEVSP